MSLFIGVMSGTSMDAVDTTLVEFGDHHPRQIATASTAWPATLRERLNSAAMGSPLTATQLAILDADTGAFIAGAIDNLLQSNGIDPTTIEAIGCHGQTIAHAPEHEPGATLQLGDANLITERTGITTVNDFRRRDMAAGGEGAPLAPVFHEAMLHDPTETRVVLNLGGIANLTLLPKDPQQAAIGLDTGPASCLMDGWCRQQLGQPFDDGGAWAASATADAGLLKALLDDPYFDLPAPKSTGTQHFSPQWLQQRLRGFAGLDPAVVQATLLALTVHTVSDAIERHAAEAKRILVSGGGVNNTHLMDRLGEHLGRPVESTAQYGIPPQSMETMAFAWMAKRTLEGLPGNLASVTGAAGPRILGAIHPA